MAYQEVLQGENGPQHFLRLQEQLYARCRWQGITIRSPDDCLIAACALEAAQPLLHADRDFERIAAIEPQLQLIP